MHTTTHEFLAADTTSITGPLPTPHVKEGLAQLIADRCGHRGYQISGGPIKVVARGTQVFVTWTHYSGKAEIPDTLKEYVEAITNQAKGWIETVDRLLPILSLLDMTPLVRNVAKHEQDLGDMLTRFDELTAIISNAEAERSTETSEGNGWARALMEAHALSDHTGELAVVLQHPKEGHYIVEVENEAHKARVMQNFIPVASIQAEKERMV